MLGELIGLMALTIILATLCCFNIINPGADEYSRTAARAAFSIFIVLVSVVISYVVFYLQNNYSMNI